MLPKPKKKFDVLIEPLVYGYDENKIPYISDIGFFLWVDSKYVNEIRKIIGIMGVGDSEIAGRYLVTIDKRYDMKDLQDAIVQYVHFIEKDDVIWSTSQINKFGE